MNELIKVINTNGKQAISLKDLYLFLGYDKSQWARWYAMNILENQFALHGVDYDRLDIVSNGNKTTDFAITLDFAKKISMMAKTEKGEEARNYFIEIEKKYKSQLTLPSTYLDALKALVVSEEQKQLAESKVLELEPKAEVFDKLSNGINHLTFADASKSLNWGRNTLLKVLRNRMILRHNNTPYQRYIDEGYFVVKISPITISGIVQNMPQTYVTAKGLIWLSKNI